jgi:hypothetical protein
LYIHYFGKLSLFNGLKKLYHNGGAKQQIRVLQWKKSANFTTEKSVNPNLAHLGAHFCGSRRGEVRGFFPL